MKNRVRLLLIFAAVLCLTASAPAQTLLRWNLKPGESFQVAVTQETDSQVAFSGKQSATKIDLAMDLGWKVLFADEKSIRIQQSIERVQFKLNSPQAGTIEYDSAAQAKPAGAARDVSEAVKPLLGAQVELTMNGRGEVLDAKPVGADAQKLFAEGDSAAAGVFSKQAIQQLLRQPLALLPDKAVDKGNTWTTTTEITAQAGKFQQETTYTLAGEVERDGGQLTKIDVTAKLTSLAAENNGKPKLALKSHQQTGTILFSPAAGRLVEAETTQEMVTERPYRETTIVVTLKSQQRTTVTPAK
jgi:hypothetical protein